MIKCSELKEINGVKVHIKDLLGKEETVTQPL